MAAKPKNVEAVYRLTPTQEGLLFHALLEPESPVYLLQTTLELTGAVDDRLLRRSVEALVARHAALRTGFHWQDLERPVQVVARQVRLPWREIDARGRDPQAIDEWVAGIEAEELAAGFDLGRPPLVRMVVVRTGDTSRRLVWTFHHLILDGWCLPILFAELTALYGAGRDSRAGSGLLLPRAPSFGDFVAWLGRRDASNLRDDEAYWRERLGDWRRPTPIDYLTLEAPGAVEPPYRRARTEDLGPELGGRLRRRAEGLGVTLNNLTEAVWALLLARASGDEEVVFGLTTSGRSAPVPGIERMVGLAIRTLPLRLAVPRQETVGDWLRRVRDEHARLLEHEMSSLPDVRRWSGVAADRPLFESILVFENYPQADGAAAALPFEIDVIHLASPVDVPLALVVVDGDSPQVRLRWDARRIHDASAERLMARLRRLLDAVAASDDAEPLGHLEGRSMLSDDERQQLLAGASPGVPTPVPGGGEPFLERWRRHLAADPNAPALAWEETDQRPPGNWTRGELARRVDALAAALGKAGVTPDGPERLVGVVLPRSPEQVVAVVATLLAGGAVVPLDPTAPPERLAAVVADARPDVLVGEAATVATLGLDDRSNRGVPVVSPDAAAPGPAPGGVIDPDRLAYVLHTSGSTGSPKGVAISRGALARRLDWLEATHALGADDTALAKTPLGFDVGLRELLWPLAVGARLVLARPGAEADPRHLVRLAARERPAVLSAVPSLLGPLAEAVEELRQAGEIAPDEPAIGRLLSGGETLAAGLARQLAATLPDTELWNQYGPTEVTITATAHRVEPGDDPVPVGRPIDGAVGIVLDAASRLAFPGAPGELAVGGPALARGYLGRPAATAEAFVPDPYTDTPGSRLYRTGDLVRHRADGALVFLGRLDSQVQVRGLRVELEEVEAAVASHPAVAECAVVPVEEDSSTADGLVAWVVMAEMPEMPEMPETTQSAELPADLARAIKQHAARFLPAPAVPVRILRLEALPRTASLKLDRRALAALPTPELASPRGASDRAGSAASVASAASVDPLVEILADLWADVLGLPAGAVGPAASFFDLGGHSLTAVRLASRLASRLALELPLAALLDHPTPASAAAWIQLQGPGGGADAPALAPLPPLAPSFDDGPAPLTFAQERFWFLDRLSRRRERHHIPFALELVGDLVPSALARALAGLVVRHEVLRTRYPVIATGIDRDDRGDRGDRDDRDQDGRPVQVVDPAPGHPAAALPVVDLSALPEARREAAARAAREASARRPFDLAAGPVARSFLARLGTDHHQLAVTVHHIATDGWSTHLLVGELAALYRAAVTGGVAALAKPTLRMTDVARWQRGALVGEALDSRLEGWRRLLDGGLPTLELPVDRPRGARAARGDRAADAAAVVVPLHLDGDVLARVDAFARSRGATRFVVLATVYGALVGRWAGGERFGLGVPVAGRHHLETERLPGLFVNTLVLPVARGDRPSLATLGRRLRDDLLTALTLQDLPFEKLVAELVPAAARSAANPLFQVVVNLQNAPARELDLPGVEARPLETATGAAQFDLSLGLTDTGGAGDGGAIEGGLVADGALFDRSTVERLAVAFGLLLAAATAEPKKPLDDLSLLTDIARAELLAEGTGQSPERPPTDPWTAIAARWSADPAATVLVWEGGSWTAAELSRRVLGLARALRERGVSAHGPETRVGILLSRSPEQVVAVLATLAAGGAFLPLDPGLPPERLAAIVAVADGRPDLLVGTDDAVRRAGLDHLAVPLVAPDATGSEAPDEELGGEVHPLRLAYVIHTSGSTGTPKGVAVPRGALARRMVWLMRVHPLTPRDTALAKTPLTFDVGVRELLWPLAVGARLVLAAPGVEADPRRLAVLAARERPAVLAAVPSLLGPFADAIEELRAAGELAADAPRIVRLMSGGETLSASLARRLTRVLPGTALWNQYGPTEVTINASAHPVDPQVDDPVPIGRVLDDATARVADPRGRLVLPGSVGELVVGGPALARGYLGRPGATAERFSPDPFTEIPGARLYRTGDLVRRRSDGALLFLGRADSQVQVRGLRVELVEVEAIVAAHPSVAECAVIPVQDDGRTDRLVAWVVPAAGAAVGPDWRAALVGHAAARLPAPAVPSRFLEVAELPRTASLKIDRRALAARPLPALVDQVGALPMVDPLVEILAGLWADVLEAGSVGPDTDFFELGGHSLTAVRLASRIASRLGREIPLAALLEHPTPAATASWLASHPDGDGPRLIQLPPVTPRERRDGDGAWPLTFGQERLWFLERLSPGGAAYHVPFALALDGALDVRALARALGWLVGRHEVLRTRYPERDGVPVQVVEPAAAHPAARLSVVDLSGLEGSAEAADRAAEAVRRRAARRPFDLETGPVVRSALVRLAAEHHHLAVAIHHIATDGWSTHLLVNELAALYRAAIGEGEGEGEGATSDPLPAPRLQVADVAVWQRRELVGEALDERLRGWRALLGGSPPTLDLPTTQRRSRSLLDAEDRAPGRPARTDVSIRLNPAVTERLDAFARSRGATRYAVLAALFGELLGRWSGASRFGLGAPVAGRHRLETEGMPGFFVNTLVLPVDRSGQPSLGEMTGHLRDDLFNALALQDLPFETLVAELSPRSAGGDRTERGGRNPLFQVAFTFQNVPAVDLELPGVRVSGLDVGTDEPHFDLSMALGDGPGDGTIVGGLTGDRRLLDPATVERLARGFERLVELATAAPDQPLGSLPLVEGDDRALLLDRWSGRRAGAVQAPSTDPWTAIAGRLRATPEARVLSWEASDDRPAGSLIAGDLAARTEGLARALGEHGAGGDRELRVGIVLGRSPEQVVAVLATLAAGGAFLPLDPGLPPERLKAVVEDGRPDLLVGERSTIERLGLGGVGIPVLSAEAGEGTFDELHWSEGVHPDRLAYVLHTSGSTGSPKGVAVPRGALARRLAWLAETHPLGEGDVALAKTPLTFDVGVREILWPLAVGARLVLAAPGVEADPRRLARLAARERPAVLSAVPSLLGALADAVEELRAEGVLGADEPALGRLLSGGETLPASLARRLAEVLPDTVLWNQYGPTEVTITATAHPVDWRVDEPVPIGRPIGDASAVVLDPTGALVPPGGVGELAVGGPALARGYLGRPRATAERFVPDPYVGMPHGGTPSMGVSGARLYLTGDRVRHRSDGALLFLGRSDGQVQVRGLRVELEEVEAVLAAHPAVAACAVTAVAPVGEEKAGRTDRLVAWVVLAEAADLDAGELPPEMVAALREHAERSLPAPAVPAAFVALPELPRTASLKVDRRALAERPQPTAQAREAAPTVPSMALMDPVLQVLLGLWAQVLDLEPSTVVPDSHFFDLGGHSLSAVRLASRIRQRLDREIPLAALLDHPTPAATAAWLAAHGAAADQLPALPPIAPRRRRQTEDDDTPLPLTFGQERLWFLDRLLADSASYHVPFGLKLDGDLSPAALARALGALVDRHEVLRTRYPETEAGPVQAIEPPGGHPVRWLPVVDLSGLDPERRSTTAERALRRGARRPFDLSTGPVLRAFLVRLAPASHQLGVTVHHIATDGWSTHLLVGELAALYRAEPLPAPRLQMADVALWQRRHLTDAGLDRRVEGWRRLLGDGVAPLELPTDRPRQSLDAMDAPHVAEDGDNGNRPAPRGSTTAPVHLPPSVMEALDAFARRRGATRFVVLASAFGALLGRWSGTLRFGLGVPVAGRHRLETERMPGFFVNTLVLPVDRTDDPSLETMSRRLRDDLTTALALQDLPFEKLVAELAPAGDRSGHNPLFQVAFTLQNTPTVELDLPEVTVERLPLGTGAAQFDLSLGLVELADGAVTGGLVADLALFDPATARALAGGFERLVATAVERPAEPLAALPLVTAEERAQILGQMSGRDARPHGAGKTLLDLFTDRLRSTPEATALLVPDGADPGRATPVTYRQLGDHAARIAARLEVAGVARGEVVALVAERGVPLLAGVLGVFGAGAAFLPVPPETPPERALDQLDDAGVRLVLAPAGVTAADLPGSRASGAGGRRVISLGADPEPEDDPDVVNADASALVRVALDPDDLAYVLYTSGSTGRPKGVRMHHRGPVAHVAWVVEHYSMSAGAPVLWKASLVFDPVLREIFGPFVVGTPILVTPPGAEGDPALLLGLVRAHRVEILSYVPSLLGATLDALGDEDSSGAAELGAVRQVISDGERLPRGLAGRLLAVLRRSVAVRDGESGRLTNQLGPTETAVASTYRDFVAGEPLPDRVGVGRPVPGHTAYLVDDRLELVPLGAAGELLVGGVGVAEGYGRRPGLTAERFVPDPFSGVAGSRLYRTGDLLRRSTHPRDVGELQFLGRIDRQLKLRGVRIEPGEIEAVLAEHPAVAAAAVVVVGESLVALVLPEVGQAVDPRPTDEVELPTDEILGHVRLRLPDTFVPAVVLAVEGLPRNPSGKVDRRRVAELAAAALAAERSGRTVIAPRNDDERALVALWGDLLELEGQSVSVDDGFFALGGHSLLLTRLRSRIARELEVELPLAALFADPTVAGMARAVAAERARRVTAEAAGAEARPAGAGSFEIRAVPRAGRGLTRAQLAALEDGDDG